MNIHYPLRSLCLGVSTALLIAGCATAPTPKESGFLSDYTQLSKAPAPNGGTRLAYVNPAFTPARYGALWLDAVAYYPDARPTEDVSAETLTQIRNAVDRSLRQKLGQKVRLVEHAGPGVAHVSVAITAVGAQTRSLKPYQYVPVALVLTGIRAAVDDGLPREATVAIETRVTDSDTGQLLYAAVRGGTGERVTSAAQGKGGVRLAQLQPLIDKWTDGAAREVGKYVKGK